MTTPQTQPPADAQEAAKQALVDQAQELGLGYGPPADIGEMVERLEAAASEAETEYAKSPAGPCTPFAAVEVSDLRALLTDRDDLVRKLGVAKDAIQAGAAAFRNATMLINRACDTIPIIEATTALGAALKVLDG